VKSWLWSTLKNICRLATGSSEVTTTNIFRNTCCQGKVSKLVPLHAGYSYFRELKFYYKNYYLFADLLIMIYIYIYIYIYYRLLQLVFIFCFILTLILPKITAVDVKGFRYLFCTIVIGSGFIHSVLFIYF